MIYSNFKDYKSLREFFIFFLILTQDKLKLKQKAC